MRGKTRDAGRCSTKELKYATAETGRIDVEVRSAELS